MKTSIFPFLIILTLACDRITQSPVAMLELYPTHGDSLTLFELNANKSFDDVTLFSALEFRWDFNGDGIWDTELARRAMLLRTFPDPGTYEVTIEVRDEDGLSDTTAETLIVIGENTDTSHMTDPRDGQTYKTVCINGRWWMSECLRYGVGIDPMNDIQEDNGVVECYLLWSRDLREYFCAYTWYEAVNHKMNNPQGICPDGWHLPSQQEWELLVDGFPGLYTESYYGKGGLSNLELSIGSSFMIVRWGWDPFISSGLAAFWSYEYIKQEGRQGAGWFKAYPGDYYFGLVGELNLDFNDDIQEVSTARCIKDSI